jgi:hypothetical protein
LDSRIRLAGERTIFTSYQQADAATVKQVVLHPTQRLVSG